VLPCLLCDACVRAPSLACANDRIGGRCKCEEPPGKDPLEGTLARATMRKTNEDPNTLPVEWFP